MSGGRIEFKNDAGEWVASRLIVDGYKTHRSVREFAAKYDCEARLVNRSGRVLFSTEDDKEQNR